MYISKKAASISPYVAGEQPQDQKYIKLNTNENPFPPSPNAIKALKEFDAERLRLYPDPESMLLKSAIAKKEGVLVENVFVGNGSDEILGLAFCALFDSCIEFADITYSFYPVYANLFNISYKLIPLKDNFTLDVNDYAKTKSFGGAVIANPNAPSSISVPLGGIETLIKNANGKNVIIDEAYIDFAVNTSSAALLTKKYDNALVVKTFSKSYSLAGMRCGYAIGNKNLIDALRRIKDSFNSYPVDMLCERVCAASVLDCDYFNKTRNEVINVRDFTVAALRSEGYTVLNSDANFIFVKAKNNCGKELYESLKQNKILVRHFNKPKIDGYIRITIGTKQEMQMLIEIMKKL